MAPHTSETSGKVSGTPTAFVVFVAYAWHPYICITACLQQFRFLSFRRILILVLNELAKVVVKVRRNISFNPRLGHQVS